jgi:hypothetical protein
VTVNQSGGTHHLRESNGGDAEMAGSHDLADQSHLYAAWLNTISYLIVIFPTSVINSCLLKM